jgi:hypothetical protein
MEGENKTVFRKEKWENKEKESFRIQRGTKSFENRLCLTSLEIINKVK